MSPISSHESPKGRSDEWLTPPEIVSALGRFDLDPCAPVGGWLDVEKSYDINDDGLAQPWEGRVWLNPPYSQVEKWVARLAEHGQGTLLTFARTDTRWWFNHVWPKAHALLFIKGRLKFYRPDRTQAKRSSGAPSVLIAYGHEDMEALNRSGLKGAFVGIPLGATL